MLRSLRFGTLMFCLAVSILLSAQTKSARHAIGYSSNSLGYGIGLGNVTTLQGAIYLTPDQLAKYKGQQIVGVRVAFWEHPGTECKVFIKKDLKGTPLLEQSVTGLEEGWNYIPLNAGLDIDGSGLYVGFSSKTGLFSLAMDKDASSDENGNWISVRNNTWLHTTAANTNWVGALCMEALIGGGDYSDDKIQNQVIVDQVVANYLVSSTQNLQYKAYITNLGTATLTDFDLVYILDGGEAVKKHVSGLNLANREAMELNVELDAKVADGQHTLRTYIENINSSGSKFSSKTDNTYAFNCATGDYFMPNALYEQFSTEQCSQCPNAHKLYHYVFRGHKDIVAVSNHVGFGTDQLTIDDSKWFLNFYGSGEFAPAVMVNRLVLSDAAYPVISISGYGLTYGLSAALSQPAKVRTYSKIKYDANTRKLTIQAAAEKKNDFSSGGSDLQMNLFLVEDSVFTGGMQAGAGTNYRQDNVLRQVVARVNNTYGDAVTWNGNEALGKEYVVTVPETWNMKHLKVVTFINKDGKNNFKAYQVYNSNVQRIADEVPVDPTGLATITDHISPLRYLPEMQAVLLPADMVGKKYAVFTTDGRLVMSGIAQGAEVAVGYLPSGCYLMRVEGSVAKFVK